MSSRTRAARAAGRRNTNLVVIDDPVSNNQAIDDDIQHFMEGWENGSMDDDYGPNFPVQKETFHPGSDSDRPQPVPVGLIHDMIDWEIDGQRGLVNDNTYGLGVVDSNLVEDFEMRGQQAVVRRQGNPSSVGPVGTSDHNTLLQLAYMQQVNQYYPNEESQFDVVRAV